MPHSSRPDIDDRSVKGNAAEAKRPSSVLVWARKNEIPRKVLHGSIAPFSTWLYSRGVRIQQVTPALFACLIPIVVIETLRLHSDKWNHAYIAVVGPLMRQSEKDGAINGVIWYLVGLLVVFSCFPRDISFLAIFLLSWADLAASTVGRQWGRYTPKVKGGKSVAGSLASFAVGVGCTYLVYRFLLPLYPQYNPPSSIAYHEELSKLPLYGYALLAGLVVSISELYPIIDDNLSIPIVSASVLYVVVRLTTLPYYYGVLRGHAS